MEATDQAGAAAGFTPAIWSREMKAACIFSWIAARTSSAAEIEGRITAHDKVRQVDMIAVHDELRALKKKSQTPSEVHT